MKEEDYIKVPEKDREFFLQCLQCGEWFDKRNLDEAIFHGLGHVPRPDFEYSGVMKARKCGDCEGFMMYYERKRKNYVGFWKCEDCGRVEWSLTPPKVFTAEEIYFS